VCGHGLEHFHRGPDGLAAGRGTGGESSPGPAWQHPALAGFARGGQWDTCPPSAALAAALEATSGQGATRDERVGRAARWQAMESWAAAGKLAELRDLIRDDDEPLPGGGRGDPAGGWSRSLTHEVALALAMPPQSAERLMQTAQDLETRLPRTAALLAAGELTFPKARAVADALASLSPADAARADELIAPELPGKTYGPAEKLAAQAALTVDPGSGTRRREEAERNRARVALRRDPSGAASLSGYDLPTDESLAAYASVCARAAQYHESGMFPGVRMDQFRAMAYLDLMNAVTAGQRITAGQPPAGLGAPNEYGPDDPGPDGPGDGGDHPAPEATAPDGPGPDGPGSSDDSPGGTGPDGPGVVPAWSRAARAGRRPRPPHPRRPPAR